MLENFINLQKGIKTEQLTRLLSEWEQARTKTREHNTISNLQHLRESQLRVLSELYRYREQIVNKLQLIKDMTPIVSVRELNTLKEIGVQIAMDYPLYDEEIRNIFAEMQPQCHRFADTKSKSIMKLERIAFLLQTEPFSFSLAENKFIAKDYDQFWQHRNMPKTFENLRKQDLLMKVEIEAIRSNIAHRDTNLW